MREIMFHTQQIANRWKGKKKFKEQRWSKSEDNPWRVKMELFHWQVFSATIAKVKPFSVMKSEDWVWGITEFEGDLISVERRRKCFLVEEIFYGSDYWCGSDFLWKWFSTEMEIERFLVKAYSLYIYIYMRAKATVEPL